MLTTNLKTHIAIFRDWTKINISRDQYATLRLQKENNKRSDMVTIKDPDTKEILFDGELGDIKQFLERKLDQNLWEKRWVCWYWSRHEIIWFPDNCHCTDKFKVLSIQFKDELKKLWYKIFYDSDITESMQKHYLRQLANNIT